MGRMQSPRPPKRPMPAMSALGGKLQRVLVLMLLILNCCDHIGSVSRLGRSARAIQERFNPTRPSTSNLGVNTCVQFRTTLVPRSGVSSSRPFSGLRATRDDLE